MASDPKILLLGATGQMGFRIAQVCAARAIPCTALTHAQCDLATLQAEQLHQLLDTHQPTHLINAAAYTAVDKAETERDLTFAINATAPALLAKAAHACDITLVHFSTDYVFDGARGSAPYREEAATRPLNTYGESKRAGEQAVLERGGLVFRLQWVYDTRGSNFLLRMREHFASKSQMRIVADQLGSPGYAKHLAAAVVDGLHLPADLYHLAAGGTTSWHGFACAIHQGMHRPATREIVPILTSEYTLAARRPLDTRLNTDKLARHGIRLPHWQEGLRQALEELHAAA